MNTERKPMDKESKAALRELSKLCDKAERLCVPIQRALIDVAALPRHGEITHRIDFFQSRLAIVNAALHQLEERSFQRGGGAAARHANRAMNRMRSASRSSYKEAAKQKEPEETTPSLTGKSPEFPLLSVLQFLVEQKKTGTLRIRLPHEVLSFEIFDGDIVHSSTDHPRRGERLGEILIDNGEVRMEHFMAFIDGFRSEGTLLGMALVDQEVVTQDALTAALVEQMQRHFDRAFNEKECSFEFIDSSVATRTGLHINVGEFLIETGRASDGSPDGQSDWTPNEGNWQSGWNSPETK